MPRPFHATALRTGSQCYVVSTFGSSLFLTGGLVTGVEVFRAANVGVVERRLWLGRRRDGLAVQMALHNRFHAGVRNNTRREDAAGGSRLTSLVRIVLGKPQNAEAAAIAFFRVGLAGHDAIKQSPGRAADG